MPPSNVHQLDPYKVQEIRTLGLSDDARARSLLEQVSKQGLNVGGGGGGTHEIKVRLRPARDPSSFYPYESLLGTMLHELTHNIRGPHDAQFYKLLDELTKECEDLMARGISGTGAGFDARAAGKAGGRFAGRSEILQGLGHHQKRELALKAAQERARKQALMSAGPKRLGGDLTLRQTCDPREAAAIAAERRARDNRWCPAERLAAEQAAGKGAEAALAAVLAAASGSGGGGGAGREASPAGGTPQRQAQDEAPVLPAQQQLQQQMEKEGKPQPACPAAAVAAAAGAAAAAAPTRPRLALRDSMWPSQEGEAVPAGCALPLHYGTAAAPSPGQSAASPMVLIPDSTAPGAVPQAAEAAAREPTMPSAAEAAVPGSIAAAAAPPEPVAAAAGAAPPLSALAPAAAARAAGAAAAPLPVSAAGEVEVVDLTLSDEESLSPHPTAKRRRQPAEAAAAAAEVAEAAATWACPACTLINRAVALACEACAATRPAGFYLA